MNEVSCTVENTKGLTVGTPFDVYCNSSAPDQWNGITPDNAVLKMSDADKYKIQLLKLEYPNKDQAHLVVASYKVGSHNLSGLQLVGGDHGDHVVSLSPIPFSVTSVIDQQPPPEEPYGPRGPIKLVLPFWYWLVLAAVIAFFAAIVAVRIWQRSKKKKLLEKMRVFESAQTPFFQFHQSVRKALREIGFITEGSESAELLSSAVKTVNQAYRVYLARTFLVPAMDWSEKQILSDLKKNYRGVYEEQRSGFKKSLAELSRAQAVLLRQEKLSSKDVGQLLKLVRDHVDQVDRLMTLKKAGD
jgi:hypothetical protein